MLGLGYCPRQPYICLTSVTDVTKTISQSTFRPEVKVSAVCMQTTKNKHRTGHHHKQTNVHQCILLQ